MDFRALQPVVEQAAERWEVPALAVGVSLGGTRSTALVGCDTAAVFRVASITKPFTATAAVALLGEPERLAAPTVWPGVTLAQLLSHMSGRDGECGDLHRFGDGDDALAQLVAELPGVREWLPPGEVWSYANSGYWLVGFLLAQAAGETFEDALLGFVRREIGVLEATSFGEPSLAGSGPGADAGAYPRARRPSGGLVSTMPDLLSFGEWQLATPWTDALRRPRAKPLGGVYGLGVFGERVGGVEVWGHSGSYGGFQSSLLLVPARGAVVVGLTSSAHGRQALRDVEDAISEQLVGERRRVAPTVALAAGTLDGFAGLYRNPEVEVAFTHDGSVLEVELRDLDAATGAVLARVSSRARPVGERTFELLDGIVQRDRVDFPREGFARVASRLAERVA